MLRQKDATCLVLAALLTALPLASRADEPPHVREVTNSPEGRRIEDDLARSVARDSGRIVSCSTVIDYVADLPFGHDSSFGAVCLIAYNNSERTTLLCDDWMVGKFTTKLLSKEHIASIDEISQFIHDHCPPGG